MARTARPRGRPAVETSRNGGQVQSLTRALAILAVLAESGDGMTLSDVAQIVGLPPSTVHRLLTTLQQERFVRFEPQGHLWQIGVEAFVVGSAFVRTRDVVGAARPFMRRLMEESGETVNLYVEHEGEAICMSQVECRQMMRAIARPGGRVKMHCSGAGKAMLAFLPDGEVTAHPAAARACRGSPSARSTRPSRLRARPRRDPRARLRDRRRGARGRPALRGGAGVRRARRAGRRHLALRARRRGCTPERLAGARRARRRDRRRAHAMQPAGSLSAKA